MAKEKRKSPRQRFDQDCWIRSAPDCILDASTVNISHTGVRIAVRQIDEVPDRFDVLFTRDGTVRRKVEVAWRSEDGLGLKFLRRFVPKRGRPRPAPAPAAEPTEAKT